ncbi:(deoxy)nucleoside triphosphate pyrophosphohydrolase [Marinactinospora thermotolerans]|uniref:8-oxo-dGTP diphosphatase n=1 Tax=Marinactinospora thermotolerans DSM 45154 TaxID=1122192 RepID=A0A1T4SXE3_9ACTN|nr:(deoxy)nucleoside triphosphate pyrophosphohydrolase [Marinactinospora thermotolerans]SKA32935.1 8-oxo-dGTP diphosphatase [Marinactinospora thermotolerans DSM 45154]
MTEPLIVVGAAIVRDGALLAAQRAEPPQMRGRWELPGGKVDPGETDEAALVRECEEELGVRVRLLERIGRDVAFPQRPGAPPALLRVWVADLVEGEPRPLEHLSLRWLSADALHDVDWLPADLPFLSAIRPYLESDDPVAGARGG